MLQSFQSGHWWPQSYSLSSYPASISWHQIFRNIDEGLGDIGKPVLDIVSILCVLKQNFGMRAQIIPNLLNFWTPSSTALIVVAASCFLILALRSCEMAQLTEPTKTAPLMIVAVMAITHPAAPNPLIHVAPEYRAVPAALSMAPTNSSSPHLTNCS